MKVLLWTAAAISILMGAQVSAQDVDQTHQGPEQGSALECAEGGKARSAASRRKSAKRNDKNDARRAEPTKPTRSSDEGKRSKVRRKRRSARRVKPWTQMQFTAAMAVSNSADEVEGTTATVFLGAPLTQRYGPGQFMSLGGRLEIEDCGGDCTSSRVGPALRLGTTQGSRRNTTPDWSLYAEGALMLSLTDDQPANSDEVFSSDRRSSEGPSSVVPRLSVGMSSPGVSRGIKNAIIGDGPIVSYKILLAPLFIINHAEVAVEMGGPGGSANDPRLMFFIGSGL